MGNHEIIEKAIQKAVDNGFRSPSHLWDLTGTPGVWPPRPSLRVDEYKVIFNHKFAKAIWGEGHNCDDHIDCDVMHPQRKGWKEHLVDMVLAEDPIKYLGENI